MVIQPSQKFPLWEAFKEVNFGEILAHGGFVATKTAVSDEYHNEIEEEIEVKFPYVENWEYLDVEAVPSLFEFFNRYTPCVKFDFSGVVGYHIYSVKYRSPIE